MGAEVECKSYSRLLHSVRDMKDDSSSSNWPHLYGEKSAPVLQFNNEHIQGSSQNGFLVLEKDALKQKMLEHEAIFKNQVYELHRIYRIQRNLMDEIKRKEVHVFRPSVEPASFPLLNSVNGRTSGLNVENMNSSVSCSREDSAMLNMQHSKLQRTFDLQLPADNYIDIEEEKPENGTTKFRDSVELVDLNEPISAEGAVASSVKLDLTSEYTMTKAKVATPFPERTNGFFSSSKVYNRGFLCEAGVSRSMVIPQAQGNQPDRFPLTSHLQHGAPNQVHLYPVGNPSSFRNGNLTSSFRFSSSFPSPQAPSNPPIVSGVRSQVLEHVSQNQELLTRKGLVNPSSWLTPGYRGESATSNGFYHGSTLASKGSWLDLKSARFDSRNSNRFHIAASNQQNDNCKNILKVQYQQDGPSATMAIDLNKEVPGSPSDEVVILEDLNASVHPENRISTLPWLKTMPTIVTEVASPCKLSCRNEADECAGTKSVNKIMGFSFERQAHENEPSSVASTSESTGYRSKSRMIDINMACDLDEDVGAVDAIVDSKKQATGASIQCYIDLNTSVTDCQDQQAPCGEGKSSVIEIEEQEGVEALRNAAELVLAMSLSHSQALITDEGLLEESLFEFAEAISTAEIENGAMADSLIKEMDEFEATVLQLEETKEEDYMPRPVVFELENAEETGGNASTSRSRRVQTRRGRQRRDFQRDILPGMALLSRHEVTEDVQIFSGLMKATGHRWNPGMARRNSGRNSAGRGRKRAVVETTPSPPPPPPSPPTVSPISTLLFQQLGSEDKSLTGWGKTTRRPRRQRLGQVNPATVMLS